MRTRCTRAHLVNSLLQESNVGEKTMQYTAWEHKIHIFPTRQDSRIIKSRVYRTYRSLLTNIQVSNSSDIVIMASQFKGNDLD